jgi:flavin-dependent dehydrogenase
MDDAPFARTLLARATRLTPVHAVTGFAVDVQPMAGDGWLSVGDAGGFLDPLLCSGTFTAMVGAQEAATVVLSALAAGGGPPRRLMIDSPHL